MFGSLGMPELLFIMVLALLIFGPRKLPEIGRTLGKAMGEFRRATSDLKSSIEREVMIEEQRPGPPRQPPAETQSRAQLESEPEAPATEES